MSRYRATSRPCAGSGIASTPDAPMGEWWNACGDRDCYGASGVTLYRACRPPHGQSQSGPTLLTQRLRRDGAFGALLSRRWGSGGSPATIAIITAVLRSPDRRCGPSSICSSCFLRARSSPTSRAGCARPTGALRHPETPAADTATRNHVARTRPAEACPTTANQLSRASPMAKASGRTVPPSVACRRQLGSYPRPQVG